MKRLSVILLSLALCFFSANAQKMYALLTGVSNYGDEQVNLHNTTKDVKELRKVLERQSNVNVTVVTSKYANYANIKQKLKAITQLAKSDDTVLFFFSGHGATGGFATSDEVLFQYQELVNVLKSTRARNVVVLIDACLSGSAKSISKDNFGLGNQYPKITFLTACNDDENSAENNWVGNGLFAQALLKGLRGIADENGDKQVTLIELFKYAYKDLTARTKNYDSCQHPQLIGPKSMYNLVLTRW